MLYLKRVFIAAPASALLIICLSAAASAQGGPGEIISTRVICKQPGRYIGWPSVAKTRDGELLAVFSGDRDEHVCPWGKTQMVRSRDNGRTWSAPETVNNTPLDDRDAGILVTARGTILVSWFTSLAFDDSNYQKHYPPEMAASWKRHAEKLGPEIRRQWLGSWVRRSADSGKTWGEPIRVGVTAPHGPIQLRDGRLLYAGRVNWDGPPSISVEESRDDGQTWSRIGTVPLPAGTDIGSCHEPHAVETPEGGLLVMIREQKEYIMLQSESADGGRTWTTAHSTGIWGLPPHLLRLKSGALLTVYGHRRKPFGERACVSTDNGKTWNAEKFIEIAPAPDGDLGYPASVELDDGSILTVYYQKEKAGEKTCLMGTTWRLR